MKRNTAREIAVRLSYQLSYSAEAAQTLMERTFEQEYYDTLAAEDGLYGEKPGIKQREYIRRLVTGVCSHDAELDGYIEKYAKGWRFDRISRTAAAIMRVAMYEALYIEEVPMAVAINEAVELAKKYEEKDTVAFINGVLGSFSRQEMPE